MNDLDKKDIRINMRDVFFYILRKWRFIVIMGFGCAIFFGVYRGTKLLSMIRSTEYREQALLLYEEAVEYRELETERLDWEIVSLEKKLDEKKRYQEQALLMAMDPYDSCIATADVYISSTQGAMVLTSIYQAALNDGSISQQLAEKLHVEEQYIRELVKVTSQEYITTFANENESIVDADKALLHIGLIAGDEDMARELMDGIITSLKKLSSELDGNKQLGLSNNLAVLNYTCTSRSVEELGIYQNSVQDTVKGMSEQLNTLLEEKDALETPVYELMPLKIVFLSSFKYFVLGGGIGGFLGLILLFFTCLYSNKILSPDELRKHTGLKVFTVSGIERKRLGSRVDRLINTYELDKELLSAKLVTKWMSLNSETEEYAIWGENAREIFDAVIPDSGHKTVLNMDEMDSWGCLLPEKRQEELEKDIKYILFVDREKTAYQELDYKLEVIHWLNGKDVMCVLCV